MQTPKYNTEAERSILGGLMLWPDRWDEINEIVVEKDFYAVEHQLVFRHISTLLNSGKQVDVITVAESIERTGKLDRLGGLQYLGEMASCVVSAANLKAHAKIVNKSRRERDFMAAIADLNEIAENSGDFTDKIEMATNILSALADNRRDSVVTWTEATLKAIEGVEHRHALGGEIHGLKTGLCDFDKRTGGLHHGDLIIIAGRPSMGKSCLASNIAENVALENKTVLMFSLEMSSEQLAIRSIASVGNVSLNALRSAQFNPDEWDRLAYASGKIYEKPLFIDPNPMMTASQMHMRARKIKRQHGLSLIVIDYLQLMSEGGENHNRVNEISTITRKLKLMAKDLGVPVIALSQLSRKVEERAEKRPLMSDLRESGSIEQDADVIVMMYREDYYDKESQNKGVAEANIVKLRMGETGTVRLAFKGEYSKFCNFSGTYHQNDKAKSKSKDRGMDY